MDGAGAGECGDMQDGYGESAWAAGVMVDAAATRQGAAGSSGSGQQRQAQQGARGIKRPACDEGDSAEDNGILSAEAKQRKACREKARRVNLNGLFNDLAVLLDKDHPKSDKAGIVLDATKALKSLREECDGLKQRNIQLERLNHMLMSASGSLLQQQSAVPHLAAAAQQLQSIQPHAGTAVEVPVHVQAQEPVQLQMPAPIAAPLAEPIIEQRQQQQPPMVFTAPEALPPMQPVQIQMQQQAQMHAVQMQQVQMQAAPVQQLQQPPPPQQQPPVQIQAVPPLPPPKMAHQQQVPAMPWWDLPFMFGEISELEDSLLRPPVA